MLCYIKTKKQNEWRIASAKKAAAAIGKGRGMAKGNFSGCRAGTCAQRFRRASCFSTTGVLRVAVALLAACFAGTAAATDVDICNSLQISTVTADPTKLNDVAEQDKLRNDIAENVPTISRTYELGVVGNQIVGTLTHPVTVSKAKLAEKLQGAMRAACSNLASGGSAASAFEVGLNAGGFPPASSSSSSYVLFLGSVNSLDAKGGFSSQAGAEFLSRTLVFGSRTPKGARNDSVGCLLGRGDLCKGSRTTDAVFELNYARIGALTNPADTTPASSAASATRKAVTPNADATTTIESPFSSSSGILRGNLSLEQTLIGQYFGVTGGVGFTSRTSSTAGSSTRLSPRYYAGLLFLADYGSSDNAEHTTGRVVLAYARDKFWQPADASDTTSPNQPNRIVLDARLDTPGIFKSEKVKLSFQLFVDAPTASHGPADVRFSVLISTDLQKLIGTT